MSTSRCHCQPSVLLTFLMSPSHCDVYITFLFLHFLLNFRVLFNVVIVYIVSRVVARGGVRTKDLHNIWSHVLPLTLPVLKCLVHWDFV